MKASIFCSRVGSAASRCGWRWKCSAAARGAGELTSSHTVHEQLGNTSNPSKCSRAYVRPASCLLCCWLPSLCWRGWNESLRHERSPSCSEKSTAVLRLYCSTARTLPGSPPCTSSPISLLHTLSWAPATFSNEVTSFLSSVLPDLSFCTAEHCTLDHIFEVHRFTSLQYHMLFPVLRFYVANSRGFSEAALDLHHLRGEENNDTEVQSQLMIAFTALAALLLWLDAEAASGWGQKQELFI